MLPCYACRSRQLPRPPLLLPPLLQRTVHWPEVRCCRLPQLLCLLCLLVQSAAGAQLAPLPLVWQRRLLCLLCLPFRLCRLR